MFSFVGQVRPAIFHLRDLHPPSSQDHGAVNPFDPDIETLRTECFELVHWSRRDPRIFFNLGSRFSSSACGPARQVPTSGRRDPRRLREAGQELLIALPVSRRTMLRMAAFASSRVASTATVAAPR
jgi:hypothetical protein